MIDNLVVGQSARRADRAGAAAPWRLACLLTLGAFLGLGLAAYAAGALPGDLSIRQELLVEDKSLLHAVAITVNHAGKWHVLLPACLLLFACSKVARRHWWLWSGMLLASGLVEQSSKFLVGRARPSGSALGFPSGHTTAAAVFAVSVVYLVSRERLSPAARLAIQIVAVVMMAMVGWARVVLHAHWPTDVLGGFLLGAGCAAAGAWWEIARDERPARARTAPASSVSA